MFFADLNKCSYYTFMNAYSRPTNDMYYTVL